MIEKAIPLVVFLLMFIVGASLQSDDFKRLKAHPRMIIIAALGQLILLPLAAWLLIIAMEPSPTVAGGMLLVSLCPGGAISNIYSFFARANVALSVTLTTINSIFAVIALPITVATIFPSLLDVNTGLHGVFEKQSLQLMTLLLLPVLLGMSLRHIKPELTGKIMPTLERSGALGLFLLLVAIFTQFKEQIIEQISSLMLLAMLFTFLSLIIAYCISRVLNLNKPEKAAVIIEFPVRNLALAALIAVSIFSNHQYLLFAAVFFVVQTPILLVVTFWYRSKITTQPRVPRAT